MDLAQLELYLDVGRRRARDASFVLMVACGWAAIDSALHGARAIALHLLRRSEAAPIDANLRSALALSGDAAVWILAASAWAILQWQHRAIVNVRRMNPTALRLSPRSAMFNYFVPFLNLYLPLRDMRELNRLSDPFEVPDPPVAPPADDQGYRSGGVPAPSGPRYPSAPSPILSWWPYLAATAGAWLPRLFANDNTIRTVVYVSMIGALRSALLLIASVNALRSVRAIDRRQREMHRRVVALATARKAAAPMNERLAAAWLRRVASDEPVNQIDGV